MDYLDFWDDAIEHIVILFLRKKNTSGIMLLAINIYGHQGIDNLQKDSTQLCALWETEKWLNNQYVPCPQDGRTNGK